MSESSLPRSEVPSHPSMGDSGEPPWRGTARFETIAPPGAARADPSMSVLPGASDGQPPPSAGPPTADSVPAGRDASAPGALPSSPPLPEAPAARAAPSRRQRRHRAGVIANLLPPADIPEDAEGRVLFYVLAPPIDAPLPAEPLPEAMAEAEPGPLEETLGRVVSLPLHLFLRGGMAGWAPVILLVVVFVAVFLVGMRLAR